MNIIQKIEHSIQSLKEKILNPDIKVSDLLRETKIIAYELEDKEFLKWIDKELNGYNKDDKVPQYRMVIGMPKAWNPFHGWVPLLPSTEQDAKVIDLLSKCPIKNSIPELEVMISSSSLLKVYYPEKLQKELSKAAKFNTQFALMVSSASIIKILETVKNKLLDWIINIAYLEDIEILEHKVSSQVFPNNLIEKLPNDLKILCDDFNFNYSHRRFFPCILILRLLLPRAIVRKFQKLNREDEIQKPNGEYLEPEALLNKAENLIANKRCIREVKNYKFLMDTAQHSYTIKISPEDVEGAGIKLRVLLEELFGS
jgi:hypothetical protein